MASSASNLIHSKITNILKEDQNTFKLLGELEKELNRAFDKMEDAVYALVLSLLTGEPLLFIGKPGTGKSMLIHLLCHCFDLYDLDHPEKAHAEYFEYLLTPFTEPTELFGHYDIYSLINGGQSSGQKLTRIENNMMRLAKVVYLDEVFNGSSAILNSILAFMNERVVHDRGERNRAEWEFFFAATNRIPEAKELAAIFDRFILRCRVDNLDLAGNDGLHAAADNLRSLVEKGWNQTYGTHIPKGTYKDLRASLPKLREKIKMITYPDKPGDPDLKPHLMAPGFFETLASVVENARTFDLSEMSNRRIVKMTYVLFAHHLYQVAQKGGGYLLLPEDLELVGRYFLDNMEDEQGVQVLKGLALRHSGR